MRSFYSLCLCVALGAAVGCANNIQLQDQPVDSGLSGTNPVTGADEVDEPDTGGGTVTTPGGNRAPIADAGPDLTGTVPEEIVLDASASTDPDGDILNYAWVLTEVPADSAAAAAAERSSVLAWRLLGNLDAAAALSEAR